MQAEPPQPLTLPSPHPAGGERIPTRCSSPRRTTGRGWVRGRPVRAQTA